MFIITAIITLDDGPIADISLFVPMVILLELALLIGLSIGVLFNLRKITDLMPVPTFLPPLQRFNSDHVSQQLR